VGAVRQLAAVGAPAGPPAAPAGGSASGSPTTCPVCQARLLPAATSCMDCGYMLPVAREDAAEELLNVCANCKSVNPPSESRCLRCDTKLISPGTLLHKRYRIEKQVAVGGFGAVYRAIDTQTNKLVAVKDMICSDPEEFAIRLRFFRREAEILRSMEAVPVVPRVFDFFEEGQSAQLMLEFIKGENLLKRMEATGNQPFPLEKVVEWGKLICDLLQHMHGQSPPLIHRDLKPDNIMLLEDQNTIKMIDFGTARDMGKSAKEQDQSKTKVGTQGYAPLEQFAGKPVPRSDLFALAATLYHLLTGKAPKGEETGAEIQRQLNDPQSPIPPDQRWLFELIRINLAEDAHDRYFSAAEVKADLLKRQVTQTVACPKCKATNKVRKPYCCKCAAPLTSETTCRQCGKPNGMGSRHCIFCGNRMK
jgi:serine/threonine protein kinase